MYARMSKLSLQEEERQSYQSQQLAVNEQAILQARETLESSPLREHEAHAARTAPRPAVSTTGAADTGAAASSTTAVGAGVGSSATELRVQSKYLQALQEPARGAPTTCTAEAKESDIPVSSSLHLKAELTQLDQEIGECKMAHGVFGVGTNQCTLLCCCLQRS
jgi:hypothetical protein